MEKNKEDVQLEKKTEIREPSSFRDPSGYLFRQDGELYRRIDCSYEHHYAYFTMSGLYDKLVNSGLLPKYNPCS